MGISSIERKKESPPLFYPKAPFIPRPGQYLAGPFLALFQRNE